VSVYDVSSKAYSNRVKKRSAIESIANELNFLGWYVANDSRSSSVVGPVYSDTTQHNWTSSWVELCRCKWGL